jgi:hypothetical protein
MNRHSLSIVSLSFLSVNERAFILLCSRHVEQLVLLTTRVSNKGDSYRNIFKHKVSDHNATKSEAPKPFCGPKIWSGFYAGILSFVLKS